MDIVYLSPTSVRIKGKQASFLINPSEKNKNQNDARLILDATKQTDFFHEMNGVLFQNPGEYEVKGAKVTGFPAESKVLFTLHLDSMAIFVGTVSGALLAKDTLHEHDVALLLADETLSQAVMGALNPRVLVFFGEKSEENAKAFGKDVTPIGKYSITKDKLPSETEFIFLG